VIKVVFDTSLFISAFAISGSKSEEAYLLAVKGKIRLFVSTAILAETAKKLKEKFQIPQDNIIDVIEQIGKTADVIKPQIKVEELSDDPDNRILECAVAAKANLIVTGDKHLLKLKNYQGVGIVRVADLLYTAAHTSRDVP